MTHLTEREPIVHELKTWPQYFAAVRSGKKRFEVRRNDRDFRVGDTLCLVEYDHETDVYSGAGLTCLVTYLLPGGHFGLADDVVVMSLKDAVPSDPVSGEGKCPTCASPDPARHPAVQYGGEVSICKDAFHTPPSPLSAAVHQPSNNAGYAQGAFDEAQALSAAAVEGLNHLGELRDAIRAAQEKVNKIALARLPISSQAVSAGHALVKAMKHAEALRAPPADPVRAALERAHSENERLRADADRREEAAYREGFRDAERAMDARHWDYVRGNVIAALSNIHSEA